MEVANRRAGQAVQAAGAFEQLIRRLQGATAARPASEHDRHELVVAERGRTEALELFARPIVRCHFFHMFYTQFLMNRWLPAACLFAAFLTPGCGAPPNKEMDQAQGAIDAARAAGADRYATGEYTAATAGLERAQDAVAQRDYRQALNEALDSREHAQNAAREAANNKAQARGEVERNMAQIAALIAEANTRLAAATKARVPRRVLRGPQEALAAIDQDVQKAGEAIQADDYLSAKAALQGVNERIAKAMAALPATGAQSSRRAR